MIVEAVLDAVYWLIDTLFVFELPALPETLISLWDSVLGYLQSGVAFVKSLFGDYGEAVFTYFKILLGLVIAMNGIYAVYSLVMWVLEKIPFIDIDR